MFNSSFHPSNYRPGIHLVWNIFIYTGIAQLLNSTVMAIYVCLTLAAQPLFIYMKNVFVSVRLFNKFICSTFQHHRHIWGIQCTKNTQMNTVHSFSFAHNRKSKPNFTFNGIFHQWKKIQKNKVKEKLFSFIFIFPASLSLSHFFLTVLILLLFIRSQSFSFSNSIDSCVFG